MSSKPNKKQVSKAKEKELKKENKQAPKDNAKKTKEADKDKDAEQLKEESMLKGEDHTKHMEEENKEKTDVNKEVEDLEENKKKLEELANKDLENNNVNPEDDPNVKVVKPREEYLKDQIKNSNYNQKILSGINKGMSEQMKSLQGDIKKDSLLITNVQKDLNQYLSKSVNNNKFKSHYEVYEDKQKMKTIKELKKEQDYLTKNLNKLIENEKLIKDECFSDLNNNSKLFTRNLRGSFELEEKLNQNKLKKIKESKENINLKISQIHNQISNIMTDNNESIRRIKVKDFLDNFERDKEIIEIRAKKYAKESRRLTQKMAKDIKQIAERRKKEIEEKEKKDEEKKLEILNKIRTQEKEIIKKRNKEAEEKIKKFKALVNEKPNNKLSDYLFTQNHEQFVKKEENLIKKENNKRKAMMRSITLEELKEFANNYQENKDKLNTEKEERKIKLVEEWNERRGLLPKYVSPFLERAETETKKQIEDQEAKREKAEGLKKKMNIYSEHVKNFKQPEVNKKLRKQRLDKIKSLENPVIVKDTLAKRKKQRILLIKRDKSKPSKFKWKLKLDSDDTTNMIKSNSESLISKNNLVKKPKKININSLYEKSRNVSNNNSSKGDKNIIKNPKQIDYLAQFIKEKEEKERKRAGSANSQGRISSKRRINKWTKMLTGKGSDLVANVNNVKMKVECIDQEAERQEKILKLNGGVKNNPELGEKVSNLLLDSIEAKLSILNQITKEGN